MFSLYVGTPCTGYPLTDNQISASRKDLQKSQAGFCYFEFLKLFALPNLAFLLRASKVFLPFLHTGSRQNGRNLIVHLKSDAYTIHNFTRMNWILPQLVCRRQIPQNLHLLCLPHPQSHQHHQRQH